eukprot:1338253-Amorphochlora_amoeboformis.AAC.1
MSSSGSPTTAKATTDENERRIEVGKRIIARICPYGAGKREREKRDMRKTKEIERKEREQEGESEFEIELERYFTASVASSGFIRSTISGYEHPYSCYDDVYNCT